MYREIFTKAIIAKGEKKLTDSYSINIEKDVSKVLGCWIINHIHSVYLKDKKIYIKGSYQANLWYGYDNDTSCDLKSITFDFMDEIPYVFTLESYDLNKDTIIKEYVITPPSCISMNYEKTNINISVERKYSIDVIGETKLKIKVDEVIIDQMINTDYVKENEYKRND